jgi:hypothetical protein
LLPKVIGPRILAPAPITTLLLNVGWRLPFFQVSARNSFEIITTYSGVQAMLFYRLAHNLWLLKLKWLARFISMIANITNSKN